MKLYAMKKDFPNTINTFEQLQGQGHTPTSDTYAALLNAVHDKVHVKKALFLIAGWNNIENFIWEQQFFMAIFSFAGRFENQNAFALWAWNHALTSNFPLNTRLYNALLQCSSYKVAQTETIFKKMKEQGIEADRLTYATIVRTCSREWPSKALAYYDEMVKAKVPTDMARLPLSHIAQRYAVRREEAKLQEVLQRLETAYGSRDVVLAKHRKCSLPPFSSFSPKLFLIPYVCVLQLT